jgi:hypothetical protein
MVQAIPANKVSLGTLEREFGLILDPGISALDTIQNPDGTWGRSLEPDVCATLARVKRNYEYLLKDPPVLESTVKLVVLSPLLDLAGFYQPPFRIRTEQPIAISAADEDGVEIRGAIDALVILETLWIVVIESKMSDFSLSKALPQTLSYMLANPAPLGYGLITNGSEFMFLKLQRREGPQYSTSQVFSLLAPKNELEPVLQILHRIGQQISGS